VNKKQSNQRERERERERERDLQWLILAQTLKFRQIKKSGKLSILPLEISKEESVAD
jgi:hypothetical protein